MSLQKQKPGPGYQPVIDQDGTTPAKQQPMMMYVTPPCQQSPVYPAQTMMVMYTSGTQTALVPQPMTYAPMVSCLPQVVRPQNAVRPNTHFVLTFVVFVIISLLAPEAMIFLIPALILSIMSNSAVVRGDYGRAKKLGNGALALVFLGIIFAFIVAILCVGLSLSLIPWNRAVDYYYGGCYYDYNYVPESGSGDYFVAIVC